MKSSLALKWNHNNLRFDIVKVGHVFRGELYDNNMLYVAVFILDTGKCSTTTSSSLEKFSGINNFAANHFDHAKHTQINMKSSL